MNTQFPFKPLIPARPVFGAHAQEGGVLFRIFSRHATHVWLMLFDAPDAAAPDREIELRADVHRIGDIWQVFEPEARAGQYYLWRMDGPAKDGASFDPKQWLLDPYALAVTGRETWGDLKGVGLGARATGADFPKGLILPPDDFDWGDDVRPQIPLADAVIYETHVRGYTCDASSGVKASAAGTYRGLIEKIPHLKKLGITTVELLPMQEFDEMEYRRDNDKRRELRNFWGYSTLAFFAPMARFAEKSARGEHIREFKELVKALHEAGMEVMMDVVFNHTAENGHGGPVYSFRGIDAPVYYMLEDDLKHYKNFTGCGNTVNCNHPVVNDFIVECLRYWALEYHIDGFRFDLATILTRGQNGDVLPNPPVVERIAEDPVLRSVKIIAEAWDAAGCYQVGNFPNRHWSEWNGRYRDDIRAFWLGAPGMLSAFASRCCGSPDLYERPLQTPEKSINFITCHDGFTLADLTAYEKKNNLANCEDNRDGENHNHSSNGGEDGESKNPVVLAERERRRKNLMATLLLSQGVPMLLAGDEFARTQKGNNNAYCQDNAISWVDWSLLAKQQRLCDFIAELIAFRKAHPALRRKTFFSANERVAGKEPDIYWLGQDGAEDPDWAHDVTLACRIDGRKEKTGAAVDDDHLFLIFNAGEKPATFVLPSDAQETWTLALTTQDAPAAPEKQKDGTRHVAVEPASVTVFTAPVRRAN